MSAKKILVIDDSLTIRKMVEMVLAKEGYEVMSCRKGAEGLKLIREHHPNLILVDYKLADMSAEDFCAAVSSEDHMRKVPLILTSSNGQIVRQLYQELPGAVDYLAKPFASSVLKSMIAHLLARPMTGSFEKSLERAPAVATKVFDKIEAVKEATATLEEALSAQLSHLLPKVEDLVQPGRLDLFRDKLSEHFLKTDFIEEVIRDIINITGVGGGPDTEFECPTGLVSGREVMVYINHAELTGICSIFCDKETVQMYFQRGNIRLISSNNPKLYIHEKVAAFPVETFPEDSINLAVKTQMEQFIPLYITLNKAQKIIDQGTLRAILQACGEDCVARALFSRTTTVKFQHRTELPGFVSEYGSENSILQLLLVSYRAVCDPQVIEREVPNGDVVVDFNPYFDFYAAQVGFNCSEKLVIQLVDGKRSVKQIAGNSNLAELEVSSILYRLIKMGLMSTIYIPPMQMSNKTNGAKVLPAQ